MLTLKDGDPDAGLGAPPTVKLRCVKAAQGHKPAPVLVLWGGAQREEGGWNLSRGPRPPPVFPVEKGRLFLAISDVPRLLRLPQRPTFRLYLFIRAELRRLAVPTERAPDDPRRAWEERDKVE